MSVEREPTETQKGAWVTNLTRGRTLLLLRRPLIAALDASLITCSWLGSFAIRLDFDVVEPYRTAMLTTLPLAIVVKLAVFYRFRLFHGWWKYAGFSDLIDIARATLTGGLAVAMATLLLHGRQYFPLSVFVLDTALTFLLVGGVRFAVRAYTESFRFSSHPGSSRRVLVVGAGRSGITIVREMRANRALGYEPVGFVDDDPHKRDVRVDGVPVCGTTKDIPALLDHLPVDEVVLAFSAKSGRKVQSIIDACHDHRVPLKMVPSMGDLIDGRISVNRIRNVRIDDLLDREVIRTNLGLGEQWNRKYGRRLDLGPPE